LRQLAEGADQGDIDELVDREELGGGGDVARLRRELKSVKGHQNNIHIAKEEHHHQSNQPTTKKKKKNKKRKRLPFEPLKKSKKKR